jgi:hypothetical protein
MPPSELNLIKQFSCTRCGARPMASCKKQNGENRIYPFAEGSAAEEWVHPARRNAALKARVISNPGKGLTPEMLRKMRGR